MKNNEYLYLDGNNLIVLLEGLRTFMDKCVKTVYKPDAFREAAQELTFQLTKAKEMLTNVDEQYAQPKLPLMNETPQYQPDWQKEQDYIRAVVNRLDKQPHPKKGKRPADAVIDQLNGILDIMDRLDEKISRKKVPALYIDYGKREFEDYQTNYWRRIERKQLKEIERLTVGKEEFCREQWKEACSRLKEDTTSVLNDGGFAAYYEALGRELWYYRHSNKPDVCLRVLENMLLVRYYLQRMSMELLWKETLPVRETPVRKERIDSDHDDVRTILEKFVESHPSPKPECNVEYFHRLVDELVANGLGGMVKEKIKPRNRLKFVYQLLCLLQKEGVVAPFSPKDLEPCFTAIGHVSSFPNRDTFARYSREALNTGKELSDWVQTYLKTHPQK